MFARLIAATGAPALIAALALTPRLRSEVARHIALVEIMARKLLLADAAQLIPPPQQQRGPRLIEIPLHASGLYTCPPIRRRKHTPARLIDPADPETWNARFALALPRDRRAVPERRAPRIRALWGDTPSPPPASKPAPRRRHSCAFRLARRAEALRRLFENPAPYAARLARARPIGVNRSRETINRYALRAPRRFIGDHRDPKLTLDIFQAALRARDILFDSS